MLHHVRMFFWVNILELRELSLEIGGLAGDMGVLLESRRC